MSGIYYSVEAKSIYSLFLSEKAMSLANATEAYSLNLFQSKTVITSDVVFNPCVVFESEGPIYISLFNVNLFHTK